MAVSRRRRRTRTDCRLVSEVAIYVNDHLDMIVWSEVISFFYNYMFSIVGIADSPISQGVNVYTADNCMANRTSSCHV